LYPTFECIGLRLSYTGDANSNATAKLKYREKGSSSGAMLCPGAYPRNRFAGSIFFLTPGRQFEVQVTLDDPDGAALERASGIVATGLRFPTGGGGTGMSRLVVRTTTTVRVWPPFAVSPARRRKPVPGT